MSVTTCGVTIGSVNNATITITDDDRKCYYKHTYVLSFHHLPLGGIVLLSQSQYSVAESDNELTGILTMNSRASKDVIVEVTISDGSATGNVE